MTVSDSLFATLEQTPAVQSLRQRVEELSRRIETLTAELHQRLVGHET